MDQGAKTIRQVEDGFEVEEEMGLVVLVMFPRDDDHMLRGERETFHVFSRIIFSWVKVVGPASICGAPRWLLCWNVVRVAFPQEICFRLNSSRK